MQSLRVGNSLRSSDSHFSWGRYTNSIARNDTGLPAQLRQERLIPFWILDFGFWILDFRFWILKALPVGSFTNSNVASLNPIGITNTNLSSSSPQYNQTVLRGQFQGCLAF